MTEINEFTNTLTRITAGGTGQQAIDKLNLPLGQIESALNTLAGRISGLTNKCAVVKKDAPLSSDCYVGALVYFNTETDHMRYEPALAALLGEPGEQGQSVEAPSARVVGIVLSKGSTADASGNVQGTLLLGGYWEDAGVVAGALGAGPVPGVYYLSPYTAGKATADPQYHLRQPVLCYEGGAKLTMGLQYMAHDNHFHASLALESAYWAPVSSAPSGVTPPAGAVWIYLNNTTQAFVNLGELSSRTTAVFHDGILQTEDTFVVSGGYLWCKNAQAPAQNSVTIFNSYPFAYGSAVVRGIQSGNDALTVQFQNGLVTITQNDFAQGDISNTPLAVSGVNGKTLNMTHVVTGVQAGPGTTVSVAADGVATIASSLLADTPLDAYSINHNGTTVTSDGTFMYYTFPKGRVSNMVISQNVVGMPAAANISAKVWGMCAGGSVTVGIIAWWIPVNGEGAQSAVSLGTMSIAYNGTQAYTESTGSMTVSGNGQLVAKLTVSGAPGDDVKLARVGFIYSLV